MAPARSWKVREKNILDQRRPSSSRQVQENDPGPTIFSGSQQLEVYPDSFQHHAARHCEAVAIGRNRPELNDICRFYTPFWVSCLRLADDYLLFNSIFRGPWLVISCLRSEERRVGKSVDVCGGGYVEKKIVSRTLGREASC